MLPVKIPNQLKIPTGNYPGIFGGNQAVFPVVEDAKFPLMQYQVVFDVGVRGMYDINVIVTESDITIEERYAGPFGG